MSLTRTFNPRGIHRTRTEGFTAPEPHSETTISKISVNRERILKDSFSSLSRQFIRPEMAGLDCRISSSSELGGL